jgi:hypothetical protein
LNFEFAYFLAKNVYACEEAASGPKTFLNKFFKLLQENAQYTSLITVLVTISISTHPTVHVHFLMLYYTFENLLGFS